MSKRPLDDPWSVAAKRANLPLVAPVPVRAIAPVALPPVAPDQGRLVFTTFIAHMVIDIVLADAEIGALSGSQDLSYVPSQTPPSSASIGLQPEFDGDGKSLVSMMTHSV